MTASLTLYRQILQEHRQRLPALMRKLGDDYVRSEFKAHKAAKPEQVSCPAPLCHSLFSHTFARWYGAT